MNYTPAVWLTWRKASEIAQRDQTLIQPFHFLLSIFSMFVQPPDATFKDPTIRSEVDEVEAILSGHSLRSEQLFQTVQGKDQGTAFNLLAYDPKAAHTISRSDVCKRAIEHASLSSARESISNARLRHLLGGLLACSPDSCATLGIDPVLGARLASALSLRPVERLPETLIQEVDVPIVKRAEAAEIMLRAVNANAVLLPKIDWTVVGPKFTALCELAWQAGATGNLSGLLQTVTEKILSFIPRATHGAILMLDTKTGELDLKAHAPRGSVSLSRSSAQQALDLKQAFIWQRQTEMTQTQLASMIESGVYAPIIADGTVFGVICLNSRSLASRLTDEDLFLAASLGHQIGLVLANRILKAEIAQKVSVLERLMTNFSPQVRTHLIQRAQAGRLKLGGERSDVAVLCADIRGFTVMASSMDADDLIALLNDYFAAMVECVFNHEGTVDKFIGDALLVVFGSPEPHPRYTEQAARAALAMQRAIKEVSDRRRQHGHICCEIGIGVHAGEVIHGFIGSVDRMEFTVIGDTVNLTSRYCAAAGPAEIIISPEVYEKLWRKIQVEVTEVSTKHEGKLQAYKLVSMDA